jgi:hypothetical protein
MTADQQPWLANPEWVRKRVSGAFVSNPKTNAIGWLAGSLALGFGAIGLITKGADTWNERNPAFLILMIFPLVGVVLLYSQYRVGLLARR